MRKIFFICLIALLQNSLTNAQSKGGEKIPVFNAKNAIGLLKYDANEVIEATKLKNEETGKLVAKAISEYNQEIEAFSFLNTLIISDIEFMVNTKQKEAMETENFEALHETQMKAKELLDPYKNSLDDSNTKLNEKLKKVLSEKEFKRWSKYSEKKIEALQPKTSKNTNNDHRSIQQGVMGSSRGGTSRQQRYY